MTTVITMSYPKSTLPEMPPLSPPLEEKTAEVTTSAKCPSKNNPPAPENPDGAPVHRVSLTLDDLEEDNDSNILAATAAAAATTTTNAKTEKITPAPPHMRTARRRSTLKSICGSCQLPKSAEDRRESWKFNTDWDEMIFDTGAYEDDCGASESSLYHVLDELGELDENDGDSEGDSGNDHDGEGGGSTESLERLSFRELLFDDPLIRENNNTTNESSSVKSENKKTKKKKGGPRRHTMEDLPQGSAVCWGGDLPNNLASKTGRQMDAQGPRGASTRTYRRTVSDMLRHEEDSSYFRTQRSGSGSTSSTKSSFTSGTGNDGKNLENVFAEILLEGDFSKGEDQEEAT